MTFFDMISFAKLFSNISNGNITMLEAETEAAAKVLKELADDAPNWNPMQKETYKNMVDAVKENTKRQLHG
ncbi:MAG: hypothetical protein HFE61_07385 [Anaerotignum sp.]|nr:hypothetical protein [Anaerotignum sp.]